jgi:hypothetical protein
MADLLGTPKLYELLAERMAADPDWADLGRGLSFSMAHVYGGEPDAAVSFRFDDGALVDIAAGSTGDADFVLSAPRTTWERMLVSGQLTPQVALMTQEMAVQGPLNELISRMQAFNHLFELLSDVASEEA